MNTTTKLCLLFCIFSFFFLSGCQKDDEEQTLEISTDNITLNSFNSGTFQVARATQAWSITSSDDWCSVTPAKGTQTPVDVKVSGKPNELPSSRIATLTVTSGNLTKKLKIVQPGLALTVDVASLEFPAEGAVKKVNISSESTAWKIAPIADSELTVTPMEGTGSAELSVEMKANTFAKEKILKIVISYRYNDRNINQEIAVKQDAGPNTPPTKPELNAPANNEQNVFVAPEFRWKAATDPEGDAILYSVFYSANQTDWISVPAKGTNRVNYTLDDVLEKNTVYYWKVVAKDAKGLKTESDVYQFTTDNTDLPKNASYTRYTGGLPLDGAIPIVFTGDGFTARDYQSGLFDRQIDQGIEHYFSVEPYKTYRQYFKVYKMVAYSSESGASRKYGEKKNTVFSTVFFGDGSLNTYMETDLDKVLKWAGTIPGITAKDANTVVVVNDPVYSGTCFHETGWGSDWSVAIVPTCDPSPYYSFKETMIHEAGGHGFGRLADEYLSYENGEPKKELTDREKEIVAISHSNGGEMNISTTKDRELIPWKHFFGLPDYKMVSIFEGTLVQRGVWRAEAASAMRDMRTPYYSAPAREAIVKRIMECTDQPYSFDEFLNKDILPSQAAIRKAAEARPIPGVGHTPPQGVKKFSR